MRSIHRRGVVVSMLWLSGCCMGGGGPSTPSSLGRCDIPASSTCIDQVAGTDFGETLAAGLVISALCESLQGTYTANEACATAGVVGTCPPSNGSGYSSHYYSTGGTPFTAESAAAACAAAVAAETAPTTPPPPSGGTTVASCTNGSLCTEQSVDDITRLAVETGCSADLQGGAPVFANAPCSRDNLLGTCAEIASETRAAGVVTVWYTTGDPPATLDSAVAICTGGGGTFTAADGTVTAPPTP